MDRPHRLSGRVGRYRIPDTTGAKHDAARSRMCLYQRHSTWRWPELLPSRPRAPFVRHDLPADRRNGLAWWGSWRADRTPPKDYLILNPSPSVLAKLRRLHKAASHLAEDAPAVLAHPEAARGLEQALIEAMMDCLGGGEVHEDNAAHGQHAVIMRRFHRAIERHLDEPLYMSDLSRQLGVSARTLQVCCQEHLGMGPKHFLLLRRMHLVRRALRESTPADTTVTEILTRYGFWHFGRFAVEYKALFGEAPSATLAHPAQ